MDEDLPISNGAGLGRLLYQLDREAYVEALNTARSASSDEAAYAEPSGNDMEAAG